jgi:hypothetical protein
MCVVRGGARRAMSSAEVRVPVLITKRERGSRAAIASIRKRDAAFADAGGVEPYKCQPGAFAL